MVIQSATLSLNVEQAKYICPHFQDNQLQTDRVDLGLSEICNN